VEDTIRVFSGRTFSSKDIEMIKWTRKTYPKLSRSELAGTICEVIEWNTPAGRAKVPQCKEYLNILEKEGILDLPPKDEKRSKKGPIKREQFEFNEILRNIYQ
jgi:hypothetical protein